MRNIMPPSYVTTLKSLVLDGESTQYDLRSRTGLTYAPVHEAIQSLEAAKLIEMTREEVGPGPLPKRFFSLTLSGLAQGFLMKDLQLASSMDKVAANWSELLPLALGKWQHYKAMGLTEEFKEAFHWTAKWILEWGYTKEHATQRFWYYIFQMTVPEVKAKWLKALRADPELREWATDEMKIWLAESRTLTEVHKKSLEVLEMTNEPDWNMVKSSLRRRLPKLAKEIEVKLDARFKEKMKSLP